MGQGIMSSLYQTQETEKKKKKITLFSWLNFIKVSTTRNKKKIQTII